MSKPFSFPPLFYLKFDRFYRPTYKDNFSPLFFVDTLVQDIFSFSFFLFISDPYFPNLSLIKPRSLVGSIPLAFFASLIRRKRHLIGLSKKTVTLLLIFPELSPLTYLSSFVPLGYLPMSLSIFPLGFLSLSSPISLSFPSFWLSLPFSFSHPLRIPRHSIFLACTQAISLPFFPLKGTGGPVITLTVQLPTHHFS